MGKNYEKSWKGYEPNYAGNTCQEKGYLCDFEPRLQVNVTSNVDPKTGIALNSAKTLTADYVCRHCGLTKRIATKTVGVDEIWTFDMILAERKAQLAEEYYASLENDAPGRSGR